MNDHSLRVKGRSIERLRAALISEYRRPLQVADVPDPVPSPTGVVLEVEATGICMSDWHSWMGHEDLPGLPHVPGHEMAGVVAAVGSEVEGWSVGHRVTVPFSIGCGRCRSCREGHTNTCDSGFTPGFTHWGSFAQLVAIEHADLNLVGLSDDMESIHAAALGCRFATAYRALVERAELEPGEWLAVHGCGGVGLSAVMIGSSLGAHVIAVDIDGASLDLAAQLGAEAVVDATGDDPAAAVRDLSDGGAHVAVDAVGRSATMANSIASLRKHGRHVQIGLLLGPDARPAIVMEPVIMGEIDILGTRGLAASSYAAMFEFIRGHSIDMSRLVTATTSLEDASAVLETMGEFGGAGVTVIDRF